MIKIIIAAAFAFIALAEQASARDTLTADRPYYVNGSATSSATCFDDPQNSNALTCAAGSDANDGLSNTSPFQTPQKCWDTIVDTLDLAGFNVSCQLSYGTVDGFVATGSPPGQRSGSSIAFVGDLTTPTNVIISATTASKAAVYVGGSDGGSTHLSVRGVQIVNNLTGADNEGGIETHNGTSIAIGHIDFGTVGGVNSNGSTFGGYHIWNHTGGYVRADATGPYHISGSAAGHIYCGGAAYLSIHGITITFETNPVHFGRFIYAGNHCNAAMDGITFANKFFATGQKFYVEGLALLSISTSDVNYFPGDSAGYANPSTGFYQ